MFTASRIGKILVRRLRLVALLALAAVDHRHGARAIECRQTAALAFDCPP